jgi:hypothetical protein
MRPGTGIGGRIDDQPESAGESEGRTMTPDAAYIRKLVKNLTATDEGMAAAQDLSHLLTHWSSLDMMNKQRIGQLLILSDHGFAMTVRDEVGRATT